jgi:hypothetical protein
LTGFENTDHYVICVLHAMMALVRAALTYSVWVLKHNCDSKTSWPFRMAQFNHTFASFGVLLKNSGIGASAAFKPISLTGDPSWGIIKFLAKGITRKNDSYSCPAHHPLNGIDAQNSTLALWFWMNKVFGIARGTMWPTPDEMEKYKVYCFHLKKWFAIRGTSGHHMPYYLHILCDHSPAMLIRWRTLWGVSNTNGEAFNKVMKTMHTHSQHCGSVGRVSKTTIHKLGKDNIFAAATHATEVTSATECAGLAQVSKNMILRIYSTYFPSIQQQAWVSQAVIVIQRQFFRWKQFNTMVHRQPIFRNNNSDESPVAMRLRIRREYLAGPSREYPVQNLLITRTRLTGKSYHIYFPIRDRWLLRRPFKIDRKDLPAYAKGWTQDGSSDFVHKHV